MGMRAVKFATIAVGVEAAFVAPAQAGTYLCVPTYAGGLVTSGGSSGSCGGSTPVQVPTAAADQQTLIDLLPYVTVKSSGIGGKPTIRFKGANVQIMRGNPAVTKDGTGNLMVGSSPDETSGSNIGSENIVVGYGHSWSGSGNVLIGEFQTASGYANLISGRQNTVSGSYNNVSGNINTVSGSYTGVLGGYNLNVTADKAILADGVGKDVHWARYDSAGRLVAASESQAGDAYFYGSPYYSLTKFNGIDTAKCAVTITVEGPDNQVTSSVASNYYGYLYARFNKPTSSGAATQAVNVPHTVMVNCNKQPGSPG
jgi:hypothetical protein